MDPRNSKEVLDISKEFHLRYAYEEVRTCPYGIVVADSKTLSATSIRPLDKDNPFLWGGYSVIFPLCSMRYCPFQFVPEAGVSVSTVDGFACVSWSYYYCSHLGIGNYTIIRGGEVSMGPNIHLPYFYSLGRLDSEVSPHHSNTWNAKNNTRIPQK